MNRYLNEMGKIVGALGYDCKKFYDNELTNLYLNYYYFLSQNEKSVSDKFCISVEDLLYAEYYWYTKFKNEYNSNYCRDEGIEQQQFKLLEVIDQKLETGIDWKKIEEIEKMAEKDKL